MYVYINTYIDKYVYKYVPRHLQHTHSKRTRSSGFLHMCNRLRQGFAQHFTVCLLATVASQRSVALSLASSWCQPHREHCLVHRLLATAAKPNARVTPSAHLANSVIWRPPCMLREIALHFLVPTPGTLLYFWVETQLADSLSRVTPRIL